MLEEWPVPPNAEKTMAWSKMIRENKGWISVNMFLPKIGEPVLVLTSAWYVFIGYRHYDDKWRLCIGYYGEIWCNNLRWHPEPFPPERESEYGIVAYWRDIPLPPKPFMRRLKEERLEAIPIFRPEYEIKE
jgi:hypothetical protein